MFALEPFLWLAFFAVGFQGLGRLTLLPLGLDKFTVNGFIHGVLGCGAFIAVLFVLALFHWLNSVTVSVLTLFGWLALIIIKLRCDGWHRPNVTVLLGSLLIISWFVPQVFGVLVPESRPDALSYHLPYARMMAEQGKLVVNPYLRYPLNALNYDLLYSVGFLFEGERLARLFHVYAAGMIATGLFSLGRILHHELTGLVAAFIFIENELVQILMVSGYIDLGLAMFVLASLYLLMIKIHNKPCHKTMLLSGVFMGLALGTKYLAWFFLPCWLLMLFVMRVNLKTLGYSLLLCLLVASPWYIRNIMLAGNPLHPFLQDLFGYWLWAPEDMIRQKEDLMLRHGIDRTWWNFVNLAQNFNSGVFDKHGGLNLLTVLGLIFMWVAIFIKKLRLLALFAIFNVVFWFWSSQIQRYLVSIVPLLALFTAYFMVQSLLLFNRAMLKNNWHDVVRIPLIVQVVFLSGLLLVSILYNTYKLSVLNNQKNVALTTQAWHELLDNNPDYELMAAINNEAKGVLKLGFMNVNHYARQVVMGDWYGLVNMQKIARETDDDAALYKRMQGLQVDYVMVDFSVSLFKRFDQKLYASDLFKLVAENSKGRVYKMIIE